MSTVRIQIPSLLARIAGVERRLTGEGETVIDVLDDVLTRVPALRVHLFDESGALRPHVLCFLNETNTRWLDSLDAPVSDGDEITILQAVSGG